jgi:hypothetical protein
LGVAHESLNAARYSQSDMTHLSDAALELAASIVKLFTLILTIPVAWITARSASKKPGRRARAKPR